MHTAMYDMLYVEVFCSAGLPFPQGQVGKSTPHPSQVPRELLLFWRLSDFPLHSDS